MAADIVVPAAARSRTDSRSCNDKTKATATNSEPAVGSLPSSHPRESISRFLRNLLVYALRPPALTEHGSLLFYMYIYIYYDLEALGTLLPRPRIRKGEKEHIPRAPVATLRESKRNGFAPFNANRFRRDRGVVTLSDD